MVRVLAQDRVRRCFRIVRKLGEIPAFTCHLIRARGIRGAMSRIASELHSDQEYVVTHHDLSSRAEIPRTDLPILMTEVTKDQVEDIEAICRVWPSEFGYWRPGPLKAKLAGDLEDGNWCFCARSNGHVMGAVWMLKEDAMLEHCPVRHMPGDRIVGRTFVVPQARGMGLSNLLYDHTVKIAMERGVPQLFGFTYPRRVASIKAKLRVDFKVIGTLTITSRFGKNTYRFAPAWT